VDGILTFDKIIAIWLPNDKTRVPCVSVCMLTHGFSRVDLMIAVLFS
jgi:hypothetical protein